MRAEFTQYAVPGWGVGELWTGGDLLLAHEFRFDADAGVRANGARARPRARPPKGAQAPPTGTVPRKTARVGHRSVPELQQLGRRPERRSATRERGLERRELGDLGELVERFTAFLAGDDVRFDDVPLEFAWATPFQRAIADALRTVPRGEVVSYGELAALAGNERAPRAAGTFCAQNRFMFVLPCHRVVGAGGIGGYGTAGVAVKRRLLALENVVL